MPSGDDYNIYLSPTLQRVLYGIMVLSGISAIIVFGIAGLVYLGVIPQSMVM